MNLSKGQGPLVLSPGEYRVSGDSINYGKDSSALDSTVTSGQAIFVNETGPLVSVQSTGTSILDLLIPNNPKIIGLDIPFEKLTLEQGEVDAAGIFPDGKLSGLRASFVKASNIVSIGGLLTIKYDSASDYENRVLCILPESYRPQNPIALGENFFVFPDGTLISRTVSKLEEYFSNQAFNDYYELSAEDIAAIEAEYEDAHTGTLIIPETTYVTF